MNVIYSLISLLIAIGNFEIAKAQCYSYSDISIYQSWYKASQFQESNNQCLANYTVVSASIIDDSASKGITCSRKGSTATGTWTLDGVEVNCSDTTGPVRCTRQHPGSVTLYTAGPYDSSGDDVAVPEGVYTCCIDGLCISIRLWQFATVGSMLLHTNRYNSQLDSCIFIPPFDITAIPQQYMIQMTTSVFPPSRLASFIDCTNCDSSVTLGESYYTLINLTNEKYQFTVPVSWSVNSNTVQQYRCRIRHGGLKESGGGDFISGQQKSVSVTASIAPSSVSHEVVNATAIRVSWSITGSVSGFVITISSGLDTVTKQLTDSTIREYVVDELLPERNYTIEVRGYYQLLGPANTTTVRLEVAGIISINGSLLSVSNDLSTQQIQVNCYTFRVEPNQVTWRIGSELIDSSYQAVNGSQIIDSVDQTYRHYITLNGSFSVGMSISCNTRVNVTITSYLSYTLQAPSQLPSGLSATILSSSSLSISWMSVSGADGYIVYYNGGEAVLIEGQDSTNMTLSGLINLTTYTIDVYSYERFYSNASRASITVFSSVPSISSLEAQSTTNDSITLLWTIPEGNIIDNYTLTVTRLCDNVVFTPTTGINGNETQYTITGLYSGLQYTVSIIPLNILGTGMESNVNATVMEGTDPPSGAPVLLVPVIINSTAISLSWRKVNCTERNGAITGYSIQYSIVGGMQFTNFNVTGDVTSTVIDGLITCAQYSIKVAAINSNGVGPDSNNHTVYIDAGMLNVTVIESIRFVQLSWQPAVDLTFEYEVVYIIDSDCSLNHTILPDDGYTVYYNTTTNTSIEVFGLIPDTCYVFGVTACSDTSNLTSINGVTVMETVVNISSQVSITYAQLSWNTLPSTSIDTYIYEVGYWVVNNSLNCMDQSIQPPNNISHINTTNGTVKLSGLKDDTCYMFGVRVYSERTDNPEKWEIIFNRTLPLVVTNLSSSYHQTTNITLYWNPLITLSDEVVVYQVGYSVIPNNTQCNDTNGTVLSINSVFDNTTNDSIVVSGLEPDTCYVFGVRAYSINYGEWNTLMLKTLPSEIIQVFSSFSVHSSSSDTVQLPYSTMTGSNIGGIISGVSVTLILIITVSVVGTSLILYFVLRQKRKKIILKSDMVEFNCNIPLYANVSSFVDSVVTDPQYATIDSLHEAVPVCVKIPKILPITVKDLGKYVLDCHNNGDEELKNQYQSLYDGNDKSCDIGLKEENKALNRFKNIISYDDNHITLTTSDGYKPSYTYINSGFVDGFSLSKKYIATQGPLPNTVDDFWHMVWQEKVQFIVMLTNLMEERKKKCTLYWPERVNDTEVFGSFTVTLLEENTAINVVTRKIKLSTTSQSRVISHYQYITWPDHGVPDSVSPLLSLTSVVTNSWSQDKGPILVHCSAGVGRTGTFIAIEIGMDQMKQEGKVDIAGIVTRLRQQRIKMIQTSAQYAFVYDAVLESSVEGTHEVCADTLECSFNKWKQCSRNTTSILEKQFEMLNCVTPQHDQVLRESAEKFPEKNRSSKYLPFEKWRVYLKNVYPDYIHATFAHGYSNHKAFIIAQTPMRSTAIDYWKMVTDYNVSGIVTCSEDFEEEEWLLYESCEIGQFIVNVTIESESSEVIRRHISINDIETKALFQVTQYQIKNWSIDGAVRNIHTILTVIQDVVKLRQSTSDGPVVVHCSDTVGCSGVFCAASNAIEQCKLEGRVSIFQAVKGLRMHKPGAVGTVNHYQSVFEVVLEYFEQNNAYSNFTIINNN